MNNSYGFQVLPEERFGPDHGIDEGEGGTLFVDVDTYPRLRHPGKVIANLYYASNHAKWNAVTEDELQKRFPKSFAKLDAGDEYAKFRAPRDASRFAS
jgi:hypothetical protein